MIIEKIKFLEPKGNQKCRLDTNIPQLSGIYFLYDSELELVYIGKSNNIRSRIQQHVSNNNHKRLNISDQGSICEYNHISCIPVGVVKYYSYLIEEDKKTRDITELFFHRVIKTRFNNCDKIKAIREYFAEKGEPQCHTK